MFNTVSRVILIFVVLIIMFSKVIKNGSKQFKMSSALDEIYSITVSKKTAKR